MAGICNKHPWPQNEAANGCAECRIEVCDFCRATPSWVYLSEDFTSVITGTYKDGHTERYVQANTAEWAACDACHDCIEAHDLDELAERAINAQWDATTPRVRDPKIRELLKRDLMKFHSTFIEGLKERPPTKIRPA